MAVQVWAVPLGIWRFFCLVILSIWLAIYHAVTLGLGYRVSPGFQFALIGTTSFFWVMLLVLALLAYQMTSVSARVAWTGFVGFFLTGGTLIMAKFMALQMLQVMLRFRCWDLLRAPQARVQGTIWAFKSLAGFVCPVAAADTSGAPDPTLSSPEAAVVAATGDTAGSAADASRDRRRSVSFAPCCNQQEHEAAAV